MHCRLDRLANRIILVRIIFPAVGSLFVFILLIFPDNDVLGASIGCENTDFGQQTIADGKAGYRRATKFQKALERCLERAADGEVEAQGILGYMYRHGYGTSRDLTLAREWYEKAAAEGNELAIRGVQFLRAQNTQSADVSDPVGSVEQELDQSDFPTQEVSREIYTRIGITCEFSSPCVIDSTSLDFRVLPRVGAVLLDAPGGVKVSEEVRPFQPWYVYGVQSNNSEGDEGPSWYAVGKGRGGFVGWLDADKVIEWRHALLASYTLPTNRNKTVMFSTYEQLKDVVDQSPEKIADELVKIRSNVEKGDAPDGIVSLEPDGFLDIDDQFYLLPIVEFKELDQLNQHALALKLAAAVPGAAAKSQPVRTRALSRPAEVAHPLCHADNATIPIAEKQANSPTASVPDVDIVFVVDLTGSMGPYLDAVRLGIGRAVERMSQQKISTGFRYGLVGYRDNHNLFDSVKFTTKVFTNTPVSDRILVKRLAKQVKSIRKTEDDWAEELFAGVVVALEDFKWRDGAWKFMIVVGDASSHEPGHPQATVKISSAEIRQLADESDVTILPIYLNSTAGGPDALIARSQYQTLGTNKHSSTPVYKEIDTETEDVAESLSKFAYQYWEALVMQTQDADVTPLYDDSIDPTICATMETAALINYVADNNVDDVTFWAADYDLENSGVEALQARVLVSRKQLGNLSTRLERVLRVMQKRNQTNSAAATELQQILYTASAGEESLIEGDSTAKLLPKWLTGLPYTSQLQEMSVREFVKKPASYHKNLRSIISRKISYYKEKLNSDDWFMLDQESNDSYRNDVTAVPLNQLP